MSVAAKVVLVWFMMLLIAIVNGGVRNKVLAPAVGRRRALPLSGLILCALVFAVVCIACRWFEPMAVGGWLLLGVVWVLMTLFFEVFFTLRKGVSLLSLFSVHRGNLFILVIAVTLLAPLLCAYGQNLIIF